MLESLTQGLSGIIRKVRGAARLSEQNIAETAEQIRDTLIDADVAVDAAEAFVGSVRERALGQEVIGNLSPAEAFIGVVHAELAAMLGKEAAPISRPISPPCPILLVGLQGTGKTTTAAKVAMHLRKLKKRVVTVSADVRRPAAMEQLSQLSEQAKIPYFEPEQKDADPVERAAASLHEGKIRIYDYIIMDSAGRHAADAELMEELVQLSQALVPAETLLVLDATQGQEALATAKEFGRRLALTGLVLSKMDGDARGGAALSARSVLGVPIKLIGTGEKIEALEQFHPDRMASRILGMGDIMGLVEKATQTVDQAKMAALQKKLRRKRSPGMSLSEMIEQLSQVDKIGTSEIADKLPASASLAMKSFAEDSSAIPRMLAVYRSMTPLERRAPNMLKASRKRRIAYGAGVEVSRVNELLLQHSQANKVMKRAARNPKAMMQMLRGMSGGGR